MMADRRTILVTVNGTTYERTVEVRRTLADFLRVDLGLTGTHIGCEHGVCGACTVVLNGRTARSCLTFAVQADGAEIQTVEGLEQPDGTLHPLQAAFQKHHGLQCGFCTPGMLMTSVELLQRQKPLTDSEVRDALSGNLCRCTGYQGIVDAVLEVAQEKGARPTEAGR